LRAAARDRLLRCAQVAAPLAADAVARLLELETPGEPRVSRIPFSELGQGGGRPEATAVVADLVGSVRGQAGLLLDSCARRFVLGRLLGRDCADSRATSALLELGNIAISAAASGIAEVAEGVVVPSLPRADDDLASALDPDGFDPPEPSMPVAVAESPLGPGAVLRFVLLLP
jgi:chemotaxis protein CheY-P-specific phosphatase CheC